MSLSVDLKKHPSKNPSITLQATVAHYFSSETQLCSHYEAGKIGAETQYLKILAVLRG